VGGRLRRVTKLRLAFVLLGVAAAVAGCGSADGKESGLAIRVEEDPFRLTLLRDGEPVAAQAADGRLRYKLRSGVQHRLTKVTSSDDGDVFEVATDEPGRTATVAVVPTGVGYRVSLRLHPETDVEQVYDAFEARADEHFLGGGERPDAVDMRGLVVPIKVSPKCAYAPVPFFASSAGWGLRLATYRISALAFPGSKGGSGCDDGAGGERCTFPRLERRLEVCVEGARLDEHLYAGPFEEVLKAYEAQVGWPRVPPLSEFELIKWRDVVSGPEDVLEDVHRFQAAGIPLGWVLLDNPWESCVGDLRFDRNRIPDPAGLVRKVHDLGVRFMLWVSPKVICGRGYQPSDLVGSRENRAVDLRRPDVVREFQTRLRKVFAIGVDGVKGDRADDVDLEPVSPTLHNEYPLLFARAVLDVLPPTAGGIFRAGTTGSQSVLPGLWAGDQRAAWAELQAVIHAAQNAAMSGFPVWGSDIGGYSSNALTPELFARWAQLGAVSPVFEVGGIGPNATPWVLGPAAMRALREAASLHYELVPYFSDLLRRREPVLRPLAYGYPDDPEAWRAHFELLVGPDLLAAPVVGRGTTPSVYLPEGRWFDLFTGERVEGGRTFTRTTPLDEFPLYARDGTVIPFNLRTQGSWWGLNELTHPGRAGFLATDGARLDLHGQPRDVQIFVPAHLPPAGVTISGRQVTWLWHSGPFSGVVVRVRGPDVVGEIALQRP
jgi:alpha-D-xyloside xylohydrolase